MYKHVVLWKLKDGANGLSKKELCIEVKRQLDELAREIAEINSYEVGINVGDYGASFFDVSLVSTFDDFESFWNYTKYPIHDKVVAYIQTVMVAEEIVDYSY